MTRSKKENFHGIQSYQKTDVLTANRETILLMLYGGAIRFLRAGIEGARLGNRAQKCENITRAQRIVSELRATLNHEVGGEIASGLETLYSFITRRLIEGVTVDDSKGLEEALALLEDLSRAWEQAVTQLRNEPAVPKQPDLIKK